MKTNIDFNLSLNEAIKAWKKLGVEKMEFEFSCGGDSMGDTDLHIIGKDGRELKLSPDDFPIADKLNQFITDEIYRNVCFYEASDGHYIGEAGTVDVTYDEDDESFHYDKSSESEFAEAYSSNVELNVNELLSQEQQDFINENIQTILKGDGWSDVIDTNFKKDLILNEESSKLLDEIGDKMTIVAESQILENGQCVTNGENFTWEVNFHQRGKAELIVNSTFTEYRPSED